MGIYFDFARKAFRQRAIYKTDLVLSVLSRFLFLFIQVSVWTVLFAARPGNGGVTLEDMVTYVILGMIVWMLTRSSIEYRIAQRVEDGTIGNDFIRPVVFKYYLIAEDVGENVFGALFSTLPACVFGALFWGIRMPDFLHGVFFIATFAGGIILIYQLNYVLGLLSFWFKESYHVDWLYGAFQTVFSGAMVPLWFYPPALRAISEAFPWQLVSFAPIAVYLGKYTVGESLRVLALQAIWFVALLGAERALWRRAQTQIEVYGG